MRALIAEKNRFVELRASGLAYRAIAKDMGVSVNTLRSWDRELGNEIAELKAVQLDELYKKYAMGKEARINRLGRLVDKLDKELEQRDFSSIDTGDLLELNLKYADELRKEVAEPRYKTDTNLTAKDIMQAISSLLEDMRNGNISKEQAVKETQVLATALKAYEVFVLDKQVQQIKNTLER